MTTSSAVRTGEVQYSPTAPASIHVYYSPATVKRKYKEIGKVSVQKRAQTSWTDVNEEKVVTHLKKEAASIGADAIILESLQEIENPVAGSAASWGGGSGWAGSSANSVNKKSARAMAIKYL